jgi:hypothetical protein
VTIGIVRRYRTPTPKWAWLRANRGSFDVEHTDPGIEIVADGRGDWVGWLELATEPVDETSTHMTAQVIDLLADQYGHVMLIDGNDTRGIDVGILTSPRSRSARCAATSTPPTPARPGSICSAATAPSTNAGCSAGRPCGCW